jgi:hypothetical protein
MPHGQFCPRAGSECDANNIAAMRAATQMIALRCALLIPASGDALPSIGDVDTARARRSEKADVMAL